MLNKLDKGITLRGLEPTRGSERTVKRLVRSVAIVLGAALCFNMVSAASATNDPNKRITSKQYAKGQLTVKLYKCVAVLYGKESAWNWKAVGNLEGTHRVYGIPQGKSEWLKDANPLEQIDWGLRYIGARYGMVRTIEGMQPDTCAALDHWKRKGWH
jgi:hypothetical protein